MKRLFILFSLAAASAGPVVSQTRSFAGRWDLTIVTPRETYPSWMEVSSSGATPEVRVVGRVASVHPASNVKLETGRLSFTTTESLGKQIQVDWEFTISGEKLSGTQKRGDGVTGQITAERAPALKHETPARWGAPQPLFDGEDLNGWAPDNPSKNHWKVIDREMVNEAAGANIRTTRTFQDFKLHIEYNCPADGNSGVYLRGRYEVQVEYEPSDKNDPQHAMGSIYGFLAPSVSLPKRPGEWEYFDITLIGRKVTIVRNGAVTIDNREIPGITGGALDSREAEPGPLYIQGDHTGGMKYRNIRISLPANP